MALYKGTRDPKPRVTNIKGTKSKSLLAYTPYQKPRNNKDTSFPNVQLEEGDPNMEREQGTTNSDRSPVGAIVLKGFSPLWSLILPRES